MSIKEEQIPLKRVDSENIWGAGYDFGTKTLRVRFRNGSEYTYHNIPESEADIILSGKRLNSEGVTEHISIGSYFNKQIVGHYEYKKSETKL